MHKTLGLSILFSLFSLLGCLGGSDSGSSSSSTNSYQGPGSEWSAELGSSSFKLTESEESLVIEGELEELSSGFKKLTVSSSSGTGAPTVGSQAYGLDIPGVVFFLKPLEANSEIITMVKSGACPTSSVTMNWVIAKMDINGDASSSGQDIFGTFTSDGSTASIPSKYALDGTSLTPTSLGAITCSSGKASITGADLYLTESGGTIVRTGTNTSSDDDDGIIVGMPGVSVASGDMDGDFIGLVFAGGETYPVSVNISGSTVEVESINVETGVADGTIDDTMTISAFNSPSAGFVAGTLSGGESVRCNANPNVSGGVGFLNCSGEDPSDNTELFALMVVEK